MFSSPPARTRDPPLFFLFLLGGLLLGCRLDIDKVCDLIIHLSFEIGDGVYELGTVRIGFLDLFDPFPGFETFPSDPDVHHAQDSWNQDGECKVHDLSWITGRQVLDTERKWIITML